MVGSIALVGDQRSHSHKTLVLELALRWSPTGANKKFHSSFGRVEFFVCARSHLIPIFLVDEYFL